MGNADLVQGLEQKSKGLKMDVSHLNLNKYRDLSSWTDQAWRELDIHLFIAGNFNRYSGSLLKRIGYQYLPNDATEIMASLFADAAYKPLKAVHQREITAQGNRRNQVMLGSLKKIAATRIVEAMIKEFPSHISLESMLLHSQVTNSYVAESTETQLSTAHLARKGGEGTASQDAFYAAGSLEDAMELENRSETPEELERSEKIEMIRGYLSPTQYLHLRYVVCDGLSPDEIAERTNCSVTNVRIVLLHARKAMLKLVPQELQAFVESSIYRKQPQA